MATNTSADKKWLSVMTVAHRLKVRYQKARDLILTGKLGETNDYETEGHLRVTEAGVAAYETRKKRRTS